MEVKTSELIDDALNEAVARCEGREIHRSKSGRWMTANYGEFNPRHGAPWYSPSTHWAQGGPIIEREEISLCREFSSGRMEWAAWTPAPIRDDAEAFGYGPTPLIAAMRCYVASKLGDEIEVPNELTGE